MRPTGLAYKKVGTKVGMLKKGMLRPAVSGTLDKEFRQKCIAVKSAYDFVKGLPNGCNIAFIEFRNTPFRKRNKIMADKKIDMSDFKRLHVNQFIESYELEGLMENAAKSRVMGSIKDLCDMYKIDKDTVYPREVLLEKDGAYALFQYSLKRLTDGEGRRVRIAVLGLECIGSKKPKESIALADSLITDEYICLIAKQVKDLSVCKRIGE